MFDPGAAVNRARLLGATLGWLVGIGPGEPLLRAAIDAVVLALRDHQMCVRVVVLPVDIAAGVNREGVRQRLIRVSSCARSRASAI